MHVQVQMYMKVYHFTCQYEPHTYLEHVLYVFILQTSFYMHIDMKFVYTSKFNTVSALVYRIL